jgi:hypothetical protein
MMNETSDMKLALKRILAGHRATLIIREENMPAARAILSALSPALQARLVLKGVK